MRVHKSYYLEGKFDRPEKVTHIVRWANQFMKEVKEARGVEDPWFLVAKRIKSLCLKNYKLARQSDARFCTEWEEYPGEMALWILARFPNGRCMLMRKDKKGNFEPNNIILKPIV